APEQAFRASKKAKRQRSGTMAGRRRNHRVTWALVFALGALATLLPEPLRAMPYQYPLNSTTIRDACFLGTNANNENAQTWALYSHALPDLAAGTNVPQVSMVTPYLRVAERCAQGPHYNNQDAMQDFLGRPVTVLVRLDLYFTPVLTNAEIDDSGDVRVRAIAPAQDLKIALIQNDEEVKPVSVQASAIFPQDLDGFDVWQPVSIGQHIEIEVRPETIEAEPLTVAVQMPDGRTAKTTFDLAKLK
ncbi:MAG: hypothetical protein WAM01_08930, partial [Candidatus Acidiferrales bacterium]